MYDLGEPFGALAKLVKLLGCLAAIGTPCILICLFLLARYLWLHLAWR